jgi:hypothetical protein
LWIQVEVVVIVVLFEVLKNRIVLSDLCPDGSDHKFKGLVPPSMLDSIVIFVTLWTFVDSVLQ